MLRMEPRNCRSIRGRIDIRPYGRDRDKSGASPAPTAATLGHLYFEEEAAFEVLLESLEEVLLFDSDLELFEPESDFFSDFFSALDSDLDSVFSVFSDFDPFSEDSDSESLPDAPFDARLSVT